MNTRAATNPDDAAFPLDAKGLTIRQYFAALAMQGLLAHPDSTGTASRLIADQAVLQADLLIVALTEGTS